MLQVHKLTMTLDKYVDEKYIMEICDLTRILCASVSIRVVKCSIEKVSFRRDYSLNKVISTNCMPNYLKQKHIESCCSIKKRVWKISVKRVGVQTRFNNDN